MVAIHATLLTHGAHPTPMLIDPRDVAAVEVREGEHRGCLILCDETRLPIDDADWVLAQMTLGIPMGEES